MYYDISAEDELIRRIPLLPSHIETDTAGNFVYDTNGRPNLSSSVFKYKPKYAFDGVSVDVMSIWKNLVSTEDLALHHSVFQHYTSSGAGYLAGIIPAAKPLSIPLPCAHDPVEATATQTANPAHALILGVIDKTTARNLADACRLVQDLGNGQLKQWPAC